MSFNPITVAQGADGYLTFFTGPDGLAGDNDLFYSRASGSLSSIAFSAYTPITGTFGSGHTGTGFAFNVTNATPADGSVAFRFDTSFQSQTDVYRFRVGGNFTPAGLAFGFFDNIPAIWMQGDGDVGINTAAPVSRLEVEDNAGGNPVVKITADDQNVYGLVIGNDTFSTTDTNGLRFYVSDAGVPVIDGGGVTALSIQIAGTERMRITTTGVGLGATPVNRLDVEGGAVFGVTYSGTSTAPSNGVLIEGAVGIGTSSPDTTNAKVEIQQTLSSTTVSSLFLENTSTGDVALALGLTGVRYYRLGIDNSDSGKFKLATATTLASDLDTGTLMTVTSAGLFGIGTSTPDNTLHVHKGSAGTVTATSNAAIVLENSTNVYLHMLVPDAQEGGIISGSPDNSVKSAIIFDNQSQLRFRTGGNITRMILSADGNLGIGPGVQPHARLTINGEIALEEQSIAPPAVDGYGHLYVKNDDTLHYKNGPGVDQIVLSSALPFNAAGADGYIAFYTDTATLAGDNDFFFDRINNRLGIGTSTPISGLHVHQDTDGDQGFAEISIQTKHPTAGYAYLACYDSSNNYMTDFGIDIAGNKTFLGNYVNNAGYIAFYTTSGGASPARMVIANTGNIGIGTEYPIEALTINGTLALQEQLGSPAFQDGYGKLYVLASDSDLYFQDDAGNSVDLSPGLSDASLKTDIRPISNALGVISELNGVRFKWNDEAFNFGQTPGKEEIGLIAQEVEKVLPEVVFENRLHKKIHYEKLTAMLIEAIKELKTEVEVLKNEIKNGNNGGNKNDR